MYADKRNPYSDSRRLLKSYLKKAGLWMMEQNIYMGESGIETLDLILQERHIHKLMLVCGNSCLKLSIIERIKKLSVQIVFFKDFQSNPTYESVVKGVKIFRKEKCEAILALGGGSAMDVAKCIKLYAFMDSSSNYLEQIPKDNEIILMAIPTTAGTGSEATKYAVIYYRGEKQSIVHPSIIPRYVVMEPKVLLKLPLYQKKAAMMDALCHGVESFWSIHSTEESKKYSENAIKIILANMDDYIDNSFEAGKYMIQAAHLAGKAINITQTTAAHAMSYKITSLYNISHGHAVILCLPKLWSYMNANIECCKDLKKQEMLKKTFNDLACIFSCDTVEQAIQNIENMIFKLKFRTPILYEKEELDVLAKSVNPVRLKNNPMQLLQEDLKNIYYNIFMKNEYRSRK